MFSRTSKTQSISLADEFNSFRSKKVKFINEKNNTFSSQELDKPTKNIDISKKPLKNQRKSSFSKEKVASSPNLITLKDLCPEDKAKIGELIKKFAEEKQEKEELLKKLEEKQRFIEVSMNEIRKENEQVALESLELKEKFKHSISLLKNLQKNSEQNKENLQNQRKILENRSPFKDKLIKSSEEIEKLHILEKRSPIKEKIISQVSSPKREILRISAGETERQLRNLESNRTKENFSSLNFEKVNNNLNRNLETERKNNQNLQKNLEENSKTLSEIGKLKEEIDSLSLNLKKLQLSSPQQTPEKPSNRKTEAPQKKEEMPKKSLYFQNLQSLTNNTKTKEMSPEINIIEEFNKEEVSDSEEEIDENMKIARKWLDSKRKREENSKQKLKQCPFNENSAEIEKTNLFSQQNLSSLRSYLDRKLEDFEEREEEKPDFSKYRTKNYHNEDLSTPKPQKKPIQLKEPSFIENSELLSEYSNKKSNKKKSEIFDMLKESLHQEVKNEISNSLKSFNLNEVLGEKIKEFLLIKDRVLNDETNNNKTNEKIEKNFKKKGNFQKKELFEKESKNLDKNTMGNIKDLSFRMNKNQEKFLIESSEKNKQNIDSNEKIDSFEKSYKSEQRHVFEKCQKNESADKSLLKSNDFSKKKECPNHPIKSPLNRSNNFSTHQQNTILQAEQEEITELLNYNEDFYENDLFDLIDEIDQKEVLRNQQRSFSDLDNRNKVQKTESSCLEEIVEENKDYFNNSYTETDVSIKEIKKQLKEMEKHHKIKK